MQSPVIIKLGGGLITLKDQLCTPKMSIIRNLAQSIHHLVKMNKRVIIVHGAGSFGHLKAKSWKLHEGRTDEGLPIEDEFTSQVEAIKSVRQDMKNLNQLVTNEFNKLGMSTISHSPHTWAFETGRNFIGDLNRFNLEENSIHFTHGDVVDCKGTTEFGILSGDDICYRLAVELNASHMIFAMGGAPGVMTLPPSNPETKLIPLWTPNKIFQGQHQSDIDVTGGIYLKLNVAEKISQHVPMVWIIDGECPERIEEVVQNGDTYGTRIISESP
ncbi:MAG: isopentenyl phosphate kinase [Candidatus Poseidoniaceae archaeon]|nr:isopentenyl phosphate kinase [Candidatus Poseidoniaceae archaeon]